MDWLAKNSFMPMLQLVTKKKKKNNKQQQQNTLISWNAGTEIQSLIFKRQNTDSEALQSV